MNLWNGVNRDLVARSIGELTFEEILSPEKTSEGFILRTRSGATYSFTGHLTVWGLLRIEARSLRRNGEDEFTASQFYQDVQEETGMSDITLGAFFEELHNTLFADVELKRKTAELSVSELAHWDGEKLQSVLPGHPKILLNKGRIGWSASDFRAYSPESGKTFQLFWVAVKKELLSADPGDLLSESFTEKVFEKDIDLRRFTILPVHPWQWDRYLEIMFAEEILSGSVIPLGRHGDFYRPQVSLRTLANASRPVKMDIKLPLTVLNTSCYRGLPSGPLSIGAKLSQRLEEVCVRDEKLRNVRVQKEVAGWTLAHKEYALVKGAPYRYHELFGGVWRESAQSLLREGEKAILTAALFHQDDRGHSLIGEYIRLSALKREEWLTAFFKVVLLPLLHLQEKYGVGLVAHGQNIVLILKNFVPEGIIIKDFHGDLRLSSELPAAGEAAFGEFADRLTRLPPNYLIHDLITGQLVTVQRFISAVMLESDRFPEEDYYRLMAGVLDAESPLLRPSFERVLLNKVRFKIGYGDSAERPLPLLGSELTNPLAAGQKERP